MPPNARITWSEPALQPIQAAPVRRLSRRVRRISRWGRVLYSAFVIDPDGMETDTYAVPADFSLIDRDNNVLKIPYPEEEIDELMPLNLDELG